MPAFFMRYFSIFFVTVGLLSVANTVLLADDLSTKELPESTRLLFKAINENDIEAARESIRQGANINAENSLGVRPTDLAVDLGYFDLAHFLLAANRTSEQQEEVIPLPPPMVSLAAQENMPTGVPPIFSVPPVLVPEVSLEALPVIEAPQFVAPKIPAPQTSAPKFVAPRISAPQFRSPTLPLTPDRAKNLPVEKTMPISPKVSEMLSTKLGSISNLEVIAPPDPPPLVTEDGTVVQIPAPLQSAKIKKIITSPPTQATASKANKPKSRDNGFVSNIWNSVTGWIPFAGNDNEENIPLNKQSEAAAPEKLNFAPASKKWVTPLVINIEEPSNKAESSFVSNIWDSMTNWPLSSDDLKKK